MYEVVVSFCNTRCCRIYCTSEPAHDQVALCIASHDVDADNLVAAYLLPPQPLGLNLCWFDYFVLFFFSFIGNRLGERDFSRSFRAPPPCSLGCSPPFSLRSGSRSPTNGSSTRFMPNKQAHQFWGAVGGRESVRAPTPQSPLQELCSPAVYAFNYALVVGVACFQRHP